MKLGVYEVVILTSFRGYMFVSPYHSHTNTHARTHTHMLTHTHARTHTHTQLTRAPGQPVMYLFSEILY